MDALTESFIQYWRQSDNKIGGCSIPRKHRRIKDAQCQIEVRIINYKLRKKHLILKNEIQVVGVGCLIHRVYQPTPINS